MQKKSKLVGPNSLFHVCAAKTAAMQVEENTADGYT